MAAVVSCIAGRARVAGTGHRQGIGRHCSQVGAAAGGTLAAKARVVATVVGRQLVKAAKVVQLVVAEMATFVRLKACQKQGRSDEL